MNVEKVKFPSEGNQHNFGDKNSSRCMLVICNIIICLSLASFNSFYLFITNIIFFLVLTFKIFTVAVLKLVILPSIGQDEMYSCLKFVKVLIINSK